MRMSAVDGPYISTYLQPGNRLNPRPHIEGGGEEEGGRHLPMGGFSELHAERLDIKADFLYKLFTDIFQGIPKVSSTCDLCVTRCDLVLQVM